MPGKAAWHSVCSLLLSERGKKEAPATASIRNALLPTRTAVPGFTSPSRRLSPNREANAFVKAALRQLRPPGGSCSLALAIGRVDGQVGGRMEKPSAAQSSPSV